MSSPTPYASLTNGEQEPSPESLTFDGFKNRQLERLKEVGWAADFLRTLTLEQWKFAHQATLAMVEKFKEPGLKIEDINIVPVAEGVGDPFGHPNFDKAYGVLMDTAPMGLWASSGSLINLLSENARPVFTIKVNGQEVDTRGMSADAYTSFILLEKARGVDPLPDSVELARSLGKEIVSTQTWLSGEGDALKNHYSAMHVVKDLAKRYRAQPDDNYHPPRSRPMLKIPAVEELTRTA